MKIPIFLFLSLWTSWAGAAERGVAQRGRKTPLALTERPSARERTDYRACRKSALESAKKRNANNPKELARWQLAQCRDAFPGTAQYVECKRDAVRAAKDDKSKLAEELKKCRIDYQKLAFDPTAELPFVLDKGRVYFAGAGLNIPRRVFDPKEQANPPRKNSFGSFSCSPLENALFADGEEEYLLFGNDPGAFKALNGKNKTELMKLLALTASKKKGAPAGASPSFQIHPRFGQIFGADTKQPLAAYFPTSHCYFDGNGGRLYAGLKVYYLLDKEKKMITPYFGAAFYQPEGSPEMAALAAKTKEALGEGYAVHSKKNGVLYIAKGELSEFDDEGDPLNLCRTADHDYIAIIKADNTQKRAEYLVLSNVSNLCKYGNRLAGSVASASHARGGTEPSTN